MKIAKIEKNEFNLDELEGYLYPLLYTPWKDKGYYPLREKLHSYLSLVISPFVTIIDIDPADLLSIAVEFISNAYPNREEKEIFYQTQRSYASPKRLIELIFGKPTWGDFPEENTHINQIGCFCSLNHTYIENRCIILANKYEPLTTGKTMPVVQITDISLLDIVNIIKKRYYTSSVLITPSGIAKYYYQKVEYLTRVIYSGSVERVDLTFCGYQLVFYYQENGEINQMATRICGRRLSGNVLAIHQVEEDIYANLSLQEIRKLDSLSYRPPDIQIREFDNPWAKYSYLEGELERRRRGGEKCAYCAEKLERGYLCPQCYRVKYCSPLCIKNSKETHQNVCLK